LELIGEGIAFIVFARNDLREWVRTRALERNDARSIAGFLYEDVICRHGCPMRIVIDILLRKFVGEAYVKSFKGSY
jgi:hypothetical protein